MLVHIAVVAYDHGRLRRELENGDIGVRLGAVLGEPAVETCRSGGDRLREKLAKIFDDRFHFAAAAFGLDQGLGSCQFLLRNEGPKTGRRNLAEHARRAEIRHRQVVEIEIGALRDRLLARPALLGAFEIAPRRRLFPLGHYPAQDERVDERLATAQRRGMCREIDGLVEEGPGAGYLGRADHIAGPLDVADRRRLDQHRGERAADEVAQPGIDGALR